MIARKPDITVFSFYANVCDSHTDQDGISPIIATLMAVIEEAYSVGARNFLIINVPPIERSPAGTWAVLLPRIACVYSQIYG